MRLIVAGGGTGGHLFPGIAVAQEVQRRHPDAHILFVGSPRGIEVRAVPKAGFELALLPVTGLRRKGLLGSASSLARIPRALLRALWLVKRFRPDVAVSVGGYAAGPAVLAAFMLGVPCVVMEQNAIPGVTNRLLARVATRVIATLPTEALPARKTLVLGNPVRRELARVAEAPYRAHQPLRVLVFGGSQGAKGINDALVAAAPDLAGMAVELRHQTGSADLDRVQRAYEHAKLAAVVQPFIDDMAEAYAWADVVLCRAGATTLAELTACGRPAVLVPYPFAVDDHQTANARTLAEAGAALLVPQSELSSDQLITILQELIHDQQRLARMAHASRALGRPDAAAQIARALEEAIEHV